jgi:hypothetical protein
LISPERKSVTSEVAGSSPVVPAIPFQHFPSPFKDWPLYAAVRPATLSAINRHEMPPILGSNCSSTVAVDDRRRRKPIRPYERWAPLGSRHAPPVAVARATVLGISLHPAARSRRHNARARDAWVGANILGIPRRLKDCCMFSAGRSFRLRIFCLGSRCAVFLVDVDALPPRRVCPLCRRFQ